MPLYEYQCQSCEARFEKIQKFSDPPVEVCPKCGGSVKKLPSSPAIQFKGSGFYITDYPKKSSSEASKAGTSQGKSESSSPASSDKTSSAPAAKPADTAKKTD
jgi:putative FmdB family regulatory protein